MNKRLFLISEYIDDGKGMVDVGTDHGYLPVYMAKQGYTGNIFASDINADPLNKAIKHASEAGLEDRINFSLSDGLSACPPDEIDTIVIAGMGGDMIVKIMDEGYWCLDERYKLILQPMSKAEILRYWLVYNGFEIIDERIAEDNNTNYQIIVTRFGGLTKLNDAELYIGKYELSPDKELYLSQLKALNKRFEKAVKDMKNGEQAPQSRLKLFEEILEQLKEMDKKYDNNI